MPDNQINIEINAKDRATPVFNSIIKALKGVRYVVKGTEAPLTNFTNNLNSIGSMGPRAILSLESAMQKMNDAVRDGRSSVMLMDNALDSMRKSASETTASLRDFRTVQASTLNPGVAQVMGKMATSSHLVKDGLNAVRNSATGVSSAMTASTRALDAQRVASARMYDPSIRNSRVLTTSIGKLIDEQHGFKRSIELTEMADYYRDLEKSSAASAKLADETKKVAGETKRTASAVSSVKGATKAAASSMDAWVRRADDAAGHIMTVFRGVGRVVRRSILVGIGTASVAMAGLTRTGLQYNGQMQTYQVMMTTYLKDSKRANKLILEAQRFAMKTPLDTTQVMKTATMLIQYGSSAENSMKITKQLADVSAGSSEKMNLLGIAFSQIAAKGKLQAEEVRQLTNAGYNPLKTIASQTGKSMGDLYKDMKAGKITFAMVQKALEADTKAGGKFYGNVMSLSKTLPGATANIKEMSKALVGHAYKGVYVWLTKVAVATQKYMGILTDGVLSGKGWTASLDKMTSAMRKAGGAASVAADYIDRINNSNFAGFLRNFKAGVTSQLKKGATFRVAVRSTLQKSEGGSAMVSIFGGVKRTLSALGPIVKGALKFLAPVLAEVGKRVVKLIGSFRQMAPLFTNVIGPLLKGVFMGVLSVIDPILSAIAWLAPWIGKLGTAAKPFSKYFEKIGYVAGMLFGGPILAGIGKFTKGFGIVGKAVRPLGQGLMKVTELVGKLTGFAGNLIVKIVGGFGKMLVPVAQFFGKFATGWVRLITWPARLYLKFVWAVAKMGGNFGKFVIEFGAKFLQKIHNMESALGKMVSKFVGKFIGGLGKIGGVLKNWGATIGNTVGSAAVSIVNKVIDGINYMIDKLRNFDTHIPKIGKPFKGLDHVPHLWDGGLVSRGSAIVGERGAEVLTMTPRGAQITPAHRLTERRGISAGALRDKVTAMGAAAAGEITVVSPVIVDGREIARATAKQVVRKAARA